ncbi:ATP-dependent RNA helicase, partial [Acrasis kona]
MKTDTISQVRLDYNIKVFHSDAESIPNPVSSFSHMSLSFPKHIQDTIHQLKFEKPTAIQSQAWPIIMSGHDMIGLAETGSGKTLAFILPALVHTEENDKLTKRKGPRILILAPTRELAQQIQSECEKYSAHGSAVHTTCLYGGEVRKSQLKNLKQNKSSIIIATPGRLLDFLQAGVISLDDITYVVLDEADRMLDMGFAPQITQICSQMRPDRQTLMFSATWNKAVQDMSDKFISQPDPFIVNIGAIGTTANQSVKQEFLFIRQDDKLKKLKKLLDDRMNKSSRVLIFCATKHCTDHVTNRLREEGWPALSMHGSRNQKEREWVIDEFKSGEAPIMVATDVAARGLDIDNITLVINYDMPNDIETYVHRIGRTGRAGKSGAAMSLFTPESVHLSRRMIELLVEAKQEVPDQLSKLHQLLR